MLGQAERRGGAGTGNIKKAKQDGVAIPQTWGWSKQLFTAAGPYVVRWIQEKRVLAPPNTGHQLNPNTTLSNQWPNTRHGPNGEASAAGGRHFPDGHSGDDRHKALLFIHLVHDGRAPGWHLEYLVRQPPFPLSEPRKVTRSDSGLRLPTLQGADRTSRAARWKHHGMACVRAYPHPPRLYCGCGKTEPGI